MAAITQLVRKLEANYERITFCYEAGPTGYELQRHIKALGHECIVVAPSLIPKKPGDRVKTNRRDAVGLVKWLRAGELTAVWVPDRRHEAMRDLTRARETAVIDLRAKRQQVSAFLLRQGRWHLVGKKTWTKVHMEWLAQQKFEQPERRMAFEEMIFAIRQAQERVARLEQAIRVQCRTGRWPSGHGFYGIARHRLVSAADLLGELGDLSRFPTAPEVMGYVGMGCTESSTGDTIQRGPITKSGNRRARRTLVECAWSYQHPPRIGVAKHQKVAAAPPKVREIAWKAQSRLNRRYRALIKRGKRKNVAITAVARELAGFVWAVAREVASAERAAK